MNYIITDNNIACEYFYSILLSRDDKKYMWKNIFIEPRLKKIL